MPLDEQAVQIEEYKELGHEVRYREQQMVQEFSFSMIAGGVAVQAVIAERVGQLTALAIQFFGTAFFALLALHLRNINHDRLCALHRKDGLRRELKFGLIHQNIGGMKRLSAPRLMFWFSVAVAVAWAIAAVATVLSISTFFIAPKPISN